VIGVAGTVDLRERLSDSLIAESIPFCSVDAAAGIPNVAARVGTLEWRMVWETHLSIEVAGRFDRR
jgi:hypothetical protein